MRLQSALAQVPEASGLCESQAHAFSTETGTPSTSLGTPLSLEPPSGDALLRGRAPRRLRRTNAERRDALRGLRYIPTRQASSGEIPPERFPSSGPFAGAQRTQTREPRAFAGGRQASHGHASGCAAGRAHSPLDGGQPASLSLRAALGRLPAPLARRKDPIGGRNLIGPGPLIRRAGCLAGWVGQSVNFTGFGGPHRDPESCDFRRFRAKPHRASSGTGKCVNFADFGPNLIGPHREGGNMWIR
jgi:hypothetical protein